MKILIIDDDEWIRDSLRIFFETEGCHVVVLVTAEEGLAELKYQAYEPYYRGLQIARLGWYRIPQTHL